MPEQESKKRQVILVGCGRVAQKHAKALHALPDLFRVIGLVDSQVEACKSLNQKYKLGLSADQYFPSLAQALSQGLTPDLVTLMTPSGTHYALARQALEHGAHVFVEKPLTLKLDEARELKALAENTGRQIAVGHIYRYFPLVDLVQEDLASGKWGKILASEVTVHWGHDQAYYDQAAWRGTWQQDGGALMNQTVHALDLMIWLLGQEPVSVQGAIARLTHQMEAEDYGAALLTMADGTVCRVEGTTNTPEKLHSAAFYLSTEQGEIHAGIRSGKPFIQALDLNGKSRGHYWSRMFKRIRQNGIMRQTKAYLNPHMGIYWDLSKALDRGLAPKADVYSGLAAVENVLAIYQSALHGGKPVTLPLEDFSLAEMENFFPPFN